MINVAIWHLAHVQERIKVNFLVPKLCLGTQFRKLCFTKRSFAGAGSQTEFGNQENQENFALFDEGPVLIKDNVERCNQKPDAG
jgi:hypothetical protein